MSVGQYIEVDVEEILTPKDGDTVTLNRWWVTRNGKLLFWERYGRRTPQCNPQQELAEAMAARLGDGCTAVYVPVGYLPEAELPDYTP